MSIKSPVLACLAILSLGLTGCATSINSFPVAADGKNRKGGIPYYMPKPMLVIKQPIETVRTEQVLAVVSLGGVKEFLYPVDIENFDQAIADLEKLIKAPAGSVKLEELKTKSIYKTEETIKTGEHNSTTTKYSTLTVPAAKEPQATVISPYAPADVEKSVSVILIPDYSKEYELVIDPSWFSSLEVGVTLSEGWRLDGLTSKTGENQLVGALKDVATSVIGAQKDVDVAKIGKEQALRLKELEIESTAGGQKLLDFEPSVNVTLRIKGYLKRVSVTTIEPGVYDLTKVIGSNDSWRIPTVNSSFVQQLQL
jgi:hypothetical protein